MTRVTTVFGGPSLRHPREYVPLQAPFGYLAPGGSVFGATWCSGLVPTPSFKAHPGFVPPRAVLDNGGILPVYSVATLLSPWHLPILMPRN